MIPLFKSFTFTSPPGVVVIDDQPEVSIDDPAFLYESNEGFQEVTSRKAQKSKQKAAAEEAQKKQVEMMLAAAAQTSGGQQLGGTANSSSRKDKKEALGKVCSLISGTSYHNPILVLQS